MIEVSDTDFGYPKRQNNALDGVSLIVSGGQVFTLLGPNGAGKTTLLRVIAGLITPQAGAIRVCGYDIRAQEYRARASIGLVLGEERSFYYRLSGRQNLEFFGGLRGIPRTLLLKRIDSLLELVGLSGEAKLQYMRYSSGMKKRLALARALLHDPQVLLLDEPNSGIDPASARTIRELLGEQRQREKTILLTTHDMAEAERLSDRIGFLKEGKLLKVGTLAEYQSLGNKKRMEFDFRIETEPIERLLLMLGERIRSVTALSDIRASGSTLSIGYNGSFNMAAVLREVSSSGLEVVRTNTYAVSLEDVFIHLARQSDVSSVSIH